MHTGPVPTAGQAGTHPSRFRGQVPKAVTGMAGAAIPARGRLALKPPSTKASRPHPVVPEEAKKR